MPGGDGETSGGAEEMAQSNDGVREAEDTFAATPKSVDNSPVSDEELPFLDSEEEQQEISNLD